jgi:hypothetical protein
MQGSAPTSKTTNLIKSNPKASTFILKYAANSMLELIVFI